MWTLETDELPINTPANEYPTSSPIAYGPNTPFAPSIYITYNNGSNNIFPINPVPVQTLDDGTVIYAVEISPNINPVNVAISSTNTTLTLANDINSISAGQYYLNPYTNTLYIADKNNQYIKNTDVLKRLEVNYQNITTPSDYIDPSLLPTIFWQLPLTGTATIGYGFENHPSGSFNLAVNKTNLAQIKEAFVPANEFTMFGYGLRVSGFSETPVANSNPYSREYNVSINIGGKWENYTNKICYLLDHNRKITNTIFQTAGEQCEYKGVNQLTSTTSTGRLATLTVNEIAKRVNVPLYGSLIPVAVPNDTPYYETVSWQSLLDERKRISGYYVDYSKETGVYCRYVKGGKTWNFNDFDVINYSGNSINALRWNPFYVPPINLQHTPISFANLPTSILNPTGYSGITQENTSIIPKSDEFRNVLLTGNFAYRLNGSPGSRTTSIKTSTTNIIEPVKSTLFGQTLKDPYVKQNLTIGFEDAADLAQQQPSKWVRKPPVRITLEQGDKNPEQPPIGTLENLYPREQYHLSLNFDSSGPTKTFVRSTSEDGSPIEEETFVYGFAFIASQIGGLNEETGQLIDPKPLTDLWQLVDYTKVTYLYDAATGYALGTNTTGWKLARFSQENDSEPETIYKAYELKELLDFKETNAPTGDELDELEAEIEEITGLINACKFNQVPKTSATRYLLKSFKSVYSDTAQERSPYETYQVCTPSGKLETRYVLDPNYVDPMFVAAETSESICFDFRINPSYRKMKREHEERNEGRVDEGLTPLSFIPPPPLITGEETYMRRTIEIIPQVAVPKTSSPFDNSGQTFTNRELYIEHTSEFNSLDPNFKSSLQNTRFVEHEGRPGIGSRKSIVFEKVEPDAGNSTSSTSSMTSSTGELKLNLISAGFEKYPENGNISYEKARTLDEALNAASTDHYIQNVTNRLSTSITIPFNPNIEVWDKISLTIEGIHYNRRVTQVSHNFDFQGVDEKGIPLVKGNTTLTLGLDEDLEYKVFQSNLPPPVPERKDDPNKPNEPPNSSQNGGYWQLGEILPLTLESRLNLRRG